FRGIVKEMGLTGKLTPDQVAKKWDNLKTKFKDLKYPPAGMESAVDSSSSWPWFHLMNEAMEGRLASSAPFLTPLTQDDDPDPAPRHRPRPVPALPPSSSSDFVQEEFADEQSRRGAEPCDGPLGGLEREWKVVERDRASVERERAAVQAERLWLDRERAALERDRALVEQERAALAREREVLDQRALMLNSVGHTHETNSPCEELKCPPVHLSTCPSALLSICPPVHLSLQPKPQT
uniref:Uncharacterized protein n=1 Tax=Kryptolebias marmoratus TaxID=37003 RepID=A0A3Q2ZZG9_KRYMA